MSGGVKHDAGKPRMDLIPMDVLLDVAKVLSFGAIKYSPWNWTLGMDYSRVQAAMLRHYAAWQSGQNLDPETNLPHLAHMTCCLIFLQYYSNNGVGNDDRNKTPQD